MKKFAMLILVLSLMCGVLTGCGNGRGNISDDKNGMVTDSPNDAEDIIDDNGNGIIDDGNRDDNREDDGNANDGNKDNPAPTSMPDNSPAITQPVTP